MRRIALTLMLGTLPAVAEATTCNDREVMAARLEQLWSERPYAGGELPDRSGTMQLYVSESGGWTIILSNERTSCIIATGRNFHLLTTVPFGIDS